MKMYRAIDAKSGKTLSEHCDVEVAIDMAFVALRGYDKNWRSHFQEEFETFQSTEGKEWVIEEYNRVPETVEDWDAEIFNNNIDSEVFVEEIIEELSKSSEGLAFLNRFAKTYNIFIN